jgi:hypothetical protein
MNRSLIASNPDIEAKAYFLGINLARQNTVLQLHFR